MLKNIFRIILSLIMVLCFTVNVYSKSLETNDNGPIVVDSSPSHSNPKYHCTSSYIINQASPHHKFKLSEKIELEKIIFWGIEKDDSPSNLFRILLEANKEKTPQFFIAKASKKQVKMNIYQYEIILKTPIVLNTEAEYKLIISAQEKNWGWLKKDKDSKKEAQCLISKDSVMAFQLYGKKAEKPQYQLGDVDHDGKLTPEDALLIASYVTEEPLKGDIDLSLADFNEDGYITISDCILLIRTLIQY